MSNLLERYRRRMFREKADKPETRAKAEPEPKRVKSIPPHIVACKVCGGYGMKDGETCLQCNGSGRVIVSHEVTTYITAYEPGKGTGDAV